jgi:signal transduction histidine kinase
MPWVLYTILPLVLAAMVGALFAVAYYRRVLAREREMERRQRSVERLAHLGTLAGGLAHEIKNPLSTVSINLQLLEEEIQKEGGANSGLYLHRITGVRHEIKRLEEVLEDFLRYAHEHQPDLKVLGVNDVLNEVLDFVTPEATQKKIRISRGFDADLQPCLIDSSRMEQTFLNIIINAQQAMPKGGELMVRTRNHRGSVQIDFIDTGTGIPPEHLPHIWDVYYSTKKGGTGLGLPTAKRIVEEHDGTIAVHSEVGKGTCFTITLPAHTGTPAS